LTVTIPTVKVLNQQTLVRLDTASECKVTGLEAALLDWYGYCSMNKLGGSGGILPKKNLLN